MTCWPQGKEELPIRSRASLAPQATRKTHTPQQSVSGAFLTPGCSCWAAGQGGGIPHGTHSSPELRPQRTPQASCCDLDCGQLPPSGHPRWERGPKHRAPRRWAAGVFIVHAGLVAAGAASAPVLRACALGQCWPP